MGRPRRSRLLNVVSAPQPTRWRGEDTPSVGSEGLARGQVPRRVPDLGEQV